MASAQLELTRQQILAFRRRVGALDARLPVGPLSLRQAAWAGLQDSMPRAALLSIHARVADPAAARLELARRYLHVFGPATPDAFAAWAGIPRRRGVAIFDALAGSLLPVRTPIGDAWLLAADQPEMRALPGPPVAARLLPSGDAYYLLQGADRALLVPDPTRRDLLWTSRVWPGAVLVDGEIAGIWRRSGAVVTVQPWQRLSRKARNAVEAEAASLPLPGIDGEISVRWER